MLSHRDRKPGHGRAELEPTGAPGKQTRVTAELGASVQRSATASGTTDDHVQAHAARGVQGASAALPHAGMIQRLFGRHDVGGIQAAVGGPAAEASAAIGARAYAAGDRVAFAAPPDLHTAAHEAAHVVQQRAGVHLAGGVGSSGDRYEQHANRVADQVVRGASAEATLDELAGGGAAGSRAVQRFDTPSHEAIGDSVAGQAVWIHGIKFTPGQLAALTDYVGGLENLEGRFTVVQISRMHDLLLAGIEDVMAWDEATGGAYSKEAQANEKHFAPAAGDGGQNFRSQFISFFARGLDAMKQGDHDQGRLLAYTAEHYLEDAFSAGHQVAARDIEAEVDATMKYFGEATAMAPLIAHGVYAQSAATIRCYDVSFLSQGYEPITEASFIKLALIGAVTKGNAGMADGVRRFVHERLASGVEVTSKAHPEPFMLQGDHSIDDGKSATSLMALQDALAESRAILEGKPDPNANTAQIATTHFEYHCPMPTSTGNDTIARALEAGTEDASAIIAAVVSTMVATIEGVMDALVLETSGVKGAAVKVVKRANPGTDEPAHFPHVPPDLDLPTPGEPVDGGAFTPGVGGTAHAPAVQRSEGTATASAAPASAAPTTATAQPDLATRLTPVSGELGTSFPLMPSIEIPAPYGTLSFSATIKAKTSEEAPAAADGTPAKGVTLSADGGPEEASVAASGVLAALLAQDLHGIADQLALTSTGKLSYSLGFGDVALPSFGPMSQKFQFQLLELTLGSEPKLAVGTFNFTNTFAVPDGYGVGGSIELSAKLAPNWWAIGRQALLGTVETGAAAGGEAAGAGELAGAAEAGAGLGAAPVVAGAIGAAIVTRLVAEAYGRAMASGRAQGIATWYVDGYVKTLSPLIYASNAHPSRVPASEAAAECQAEQARGVADAKAAFAALSPADREAIRTQYDVETFEWQVGRDLEGRLDR